jgi:DNA invertase Pin-like site-specific DNA recombinase
MVEQEAAILAVGVPMANACRDRLSRAQIKRRDPGSLARRAEMLSPPTRETPETICVASLRVFGWTMADIARALAAAGRRNASVHVVDVGKTFPAATFDAELLEALADAEKARTRGQTTAARSAAVEAAALSRERRRKGRLEQARPLWLLPDGEISAREIAERVGLSVTTLKRYFGGRGEARAMAATKENV